MKKGFLHSLFFGIALVSASLTSIVEAASQPSAFDLQKDYARVASAIRAEIARDSSLSPLANEIEIVTAENRIALRGGVSSPDERRKIMVYAQEIAGWQNIADRMHLAR